MELLDSEREFIEKRYDAKCKNFVDYRNEILQSDMIGFEIMFPPFEFSFFKANPEEAKFKWGVDIKGANLMISEIEEHTLNALLTRLDLYIKGYLEAAIRSLKNE